MYILYILYVWGFAACDFRSPRSCGSRAMTAETGLPFASLPGLGDEELPGFSASECPEETLKMGRSPHVSPLPGVAGPLETLQFRGGGLEERQEREMESYAVC